MNSQNYLQHLNHIRKSVGSPNRRLDMNDKPCSVVTPWTDIFSRKPKELLAVAYDDRNQRAVWKQGRVYWGALVQANNALFKPQANAYPANIIFSTSDTIDMNPIFISDIARTLFSLKNTHPDDTEIRKFADAITDEKKRTFNLQLPRSVIKGADVFFTTVILKPDHLPKGYLSGGIFPIMNRKNFDASLLVPHKYWPDTFKAEHW